MRRLNSAAMSMLRFFEVAARLSSFTRAAQELCITQSAVSQHIKALEDRLGCKLFFRLPRQIKLTDDGKQFAEVVARVLRELEETADTLASPRTSKIDVRLRTEPSFALGWLIPRLGRFHARHPKIKLHIIGHREHFNPAQRDFELAVEMLQVPAQGLHAELLIEEYLTPICSREYLAKHPYLITPADLAGCVLLHDRRPWQSASEDAEWRHWLNAVGTASKVDSNAGQFFTFAHMAIEAALSHQGIAMGRLSMVEKLLAARELVAPFPQRIKSAASYRLVYPSEIVGHPGISEVASWLREEAGSADKARVQVIPFRDMAVKRRRQYPSSTTVDQPQSALSGGDIRPLSYRIG